MSEETAGADSTSESSSADNPVAAALALASASQQKADAHPDQQNHVAEPPPPAPEETPMEFHKPKPVHNWREFLKEYAIIVLGVITALTGEQMVEKLRDHARAEEAQDAVRAEVVADLTRIQLRIRSAACVDARLAEIEKMIRSASGGGHFQTPSFIGRPPRYAVETARWDAAVQSGRITLLPAELQSRFSLVYTSLRYFYDMNIAEQQTWSKLDGLSGLDHLSPDGQLAMRGEAEQAWFYNSSLDQVFKIILDRAAALGLKPTYRPSHQSNLCLPTTTPAEEGRAQEFLIQH